MRCTIQPTTTNLSYTAKTERVKGRGVGGGGGGVGWPNSHGIRPSIRQLVHDFCDFLSNHIYGIATTANECSICSASLYMVFCEIFLSTVCAIATTSSVVPEWKKRDDHHYRDISQWTMERKVFFVDERLCFAINIQAGGPIICFLGVQSFFWRGGLRSTTRCQIINQSSMLLINIEPNKCLEFIQALGLSSKIKVEWASKRVIVCLFVCLLVHLTVLKLLPPETTKKKLLTSLWKMHISKTQETQKYPKSEEIMTPRPPQLPKRNILFLIFLGIQ